MYELLRAKRNAYIYRSFRDVADCDYIAARISHRFKLFDQFLWSALQAVEKYLKTIILLYDGDTRDLSHDLVKGFMRVEEIPEIHWDFEPDIKDFLKHLKGMGGDRYFTYPRGTHGQELFQLDYVVWTLRRYCEDFRWLKKAGEENRDGRYDGYIRRLQSEDYRKNANKFRLLSKGHLEKVLDTKKFPKQRTQLVYKNFYYGSYKKYKIKWQFTVTSANPSHFLHPELYPWIKDRVILSGAVKDYLEDRFESGS